MDEIACYYITLQDEADVALSNNTLRQKGFFAKHQFRDIIHTSADMDKAIDIARQIAHTNHTVLIRGESGTGKELMAQSIHNASYRNKFPFVAVNCAALPDNLLESELFGYEAGAFTGAHTKGKVGLFEQANHGTRSFRTKSAISHQSCSPACCVRYRSIRLCEWKRSYD